MSKEKDSEKGKLTEYRRKRSAGTTPEPFGQEGTVRPGIFVVHKHAARRLHYDFRLEWRGVLLSWAVPKGPSFDPQVKRLAIATEDHPVEYTDFEGVIPEGSYGAGSMIIWDRGRWIPLEDPELGLQKGKLLFELRGYKLKGVWTLFRTSRQGKEWLLVKKADPWVDKEDRPRISETSVLSGLGVEELEDSGHRLAALRERVEQRKAPRGPVRVEEVELMLAHTRRRPFSRAGWIFELKYDGYRVLAGRQGVRVQLRYRGGQDATRFFPEITRALASLPCDTFVLDGELVVLDEQGRPSFQALQRRGQLSRQADVEQAALEQPATFFAFDFLGFQEFDLRSLPLRERKSLLLEFLPEQGALRYADHVEERGEEFYQSVLRLGLEGMVAKKAHAPYRGGRSRMWLKIPADRVQEFCIVGFTDPRGSRSGFGALHLAEARDETLVYVGRVGTGFDERQLKDLRERLDSLSRDTPPCTGTLPRGDQHHWVHPRLLCQVRFKERISEGLLRQPVFLKFRESSPPSAFPPEEDPLPAVEEENRSPLRFTNLGKVLWPEEGYTKGDLVDYYRSIAPWILPYLRDRPLVMDRYPDGIHGKSFFQKNAPDFSPDWIRREQIWSEGSLRGTDYFVCENEEALLYLANLATIPIHIWSSRVSSLERPDWCILDLDPDETPFHSVVRTVREIHRICRKIGLESFVKTSGGKGLHVLLPLGGAFNYEQSKLLAELMARVVEARLPEIATASRSTAARAGKVYIDFVQNGPGKLLVSPFSVRPFAGAPVSTPLHWREVRAGLEPRKFTIQSVPRRMRRMKKDPLARVLELKPDLSRGLARLHGYLKELL